ncbi:cupin domain-containing protein [Vibrio astriarenae]|uniref:Cupin domain-containing protein n=1 Tax=Vibrio astriarenae TaxID=1481923 RepID=A0A7Z2YDR2_9VIBR|nr:cupin domain-containing protein [Vibrio astriarenae]QIA63571.1 cupin domain-containing protein [Vibrio astriarenae]
MSKFIDMIKLTDKSALESSMLPQFTPLDFRGWKGISMQNSSLFMFLFDVEPDADKFPLHADESEWMAYVIEGEGKLVAGNITCNEETEAISFQQGDFISFAPNTPHAWQPGPKKTKILFCKNI